MAKHQRKKPRYQVEEEMQKRVRIPANLAAQAKNNSYSPPEYYEDIQFKCVDCGAEEVWTAKQQQ
jgi:hypothetical protein